VAESADFLSFRNVGTLLANWLNQDQWALVSNKRVKKMRSRMMMGAVVLAVAGMVASADESAAQGIHFGVGAVHVDVGNPHYNRGFYGGGYYGGGGNFYRRTSYYHGGGHGHGGHRWHDTSHYDYHPGEYVRHRNHYHYVPGHYDWHQTGHWHHDHH
jgi:hypothetical protein